MKLFMHNTRSIAKNHDLKADQLRVWAATLSGIDRKMFVPRAAMVSKRCKIKTAVVNVSYRLFVEAGMLEQVNTEFRVTEKFVGFDDLGRGSVPIYSGKLRDLSKNRDLKLAGLRLLYYLLGDLRRRNKILNTNITEASAAIGSNRVTSAIMIGVLKEIGFLEEHNSARAVPPYGRKHYIISKDFLGTIKHNEKGD